MVFMGLLSIVPQLFAAPCVLRAPAKHATGLDFVRRDHSCWKPMVIKAKAKAKANTRTENAKVLNRRLQRKFNGTPAKPRLSVFCSKSQLYAMLVDDENKKCLFYGSTLQKAIRGHECSCTTVEAARRVGEELIKACTELNVNEISSYDRNGSSVRTERMQAFEAVISEHGFMPN